MKQIVSLSGGAASFVVGKFLHGRHAKDDIEFVFCDTTIEDPDLYRFLDDIESYFGKRIIRLCDGRTPWQVFRDRKFHGNSRLAHCSEELKSKVFAKWLKANHSYKECILHFGFGLGESNRLYKARMNWAPYKCEAILLEPPYLSRQQMLNEIDSCGIDIPRLYELGFTHNNCGGFCVKAQQGHFARLLKELPSVYEHHEKEQQKLFCEMPGLKPAIEKMENGVKHYLSLQDFRKMLQSGAEYDKSVIGGCGCFSDGGLK